MKNTINTAINYIFEKTTDVDKDVSSLVRDSYQQYKSGDGLTIPESGIIRAGKAGGLPFDSLTSDLQFGCLPATQICYGSCFAAKVAFESGLNFSHRQDNVLDETLLRRDLSILPKERGYLRNGWNSDPSWNWEKALQLATIIRDYDKATLFITKAFVKPDTQTMKKLAAVKAEIRVSISAFDSKAQLRQRLMTIEQYREVGGVAIPLVMSAAFNDQLLLEKQQRLVDYVVDRDLPAAENSLRFEQNAPVTQLIDLSRCGQVASTNDYWAGRLFDNELLIPTTTSVPPEYCGLESPYLSKNSKDFLASLWFEPVRTNREVLTLGQDLDKPSQCGVGADYQSIMEEA